MKVNPQRPWNNPEWMSRDIPRVRLTRTTATSPGRSTAWGLGACRPRPGWCQAWWWCSISGNTGRKEKWSPQLKPSKALVIYTFTQQPVAFPWSQRAGWLAVTMLFLFWVLGLKRGEQRVGDMPRGLCHNLYSSWNASGSEVSLAKGGSVSWGGSGQADGEPGFDARLPALQSLLCILRGQWFGVIWSLWTLVSS